MLEACKEYLHFCITSASGRLFADIQTNPVPYNIRWREIYTRVTATCEMQDFREYAIGRQG